MNEYGNGEPLGEFPTFTDIVNKVDTLTEVPADTYFYDKTTGTDDAETIKRYVKEGESYFECNEDGSKVDDTADSVTAENLVAYTEITDGNLSAGSAGYADKSLVLGSGADNISSGNQNKKIRLSISGSGYGNVQTTSTLVLSNCKYDNLAYVSGNPICIQVGSSTIISFGYGTYDISAYKGQNIIVYNTNYIGSGNTQWINVTTCIDVW